MPGPFYSWWRPISQWTTCADAPWWDQWPSQPAWQRGELVATEMPLLKLLHDLGRYTDTTVLISDTALATTTVSGVFRLEDPKITLQALAVRLNLELTYIDARTARLIKLRR